MNDITKTLTERGLYRPEFERDNCGFGLIAHMDGTPSHWLVTTAITALERLTHRGAIAADGKSGDGCGLLLKKPDGFLRKVAEAEGLELADRYAVGMVFLNTDAGKAKTTRNTLEKALGEEGLEVVGWREVPTDPSACGEESLKSLPLIEQVFVNAPAKVDDTSFERHLYIARRVCEKLIEPQDEMFYIPSLSSKVISYKGLVMPANLPVFYKDLGEGGGLESALCVFHQRFSTNTWPQWRLAQPFRYLAHNGEINTVQGNRNWSVARGHKFETDELPMDKVRPLVSMTGSDSNSLDNMLEALMAGGMDIFRAMRLLIPPAWQNVDTMNPDLKAFYEFSSMHMEPWDGPAGIVMTDGTHAACSMDRNGLRPARWVITKDRHITLASEIGVYDYAADDVVMKGRLKPGQMMAANTETGELLLPADIDNMLKSRHPYKKWLKENVIRLESKLKEECGEACMDEDTINVFQKMFQVSFEERDQIIRVLAEDGQEAIGSMGDDTPFPVLSKNVRSPFDNFRQQFAQVTNPPIDPIREQIVMSLETCVGRERNMFEETPQHAQRVLINTPVLSHSKFQQILKLDQNEYKSHHIELAYPADGNLERAIKDIAEQAEQAVKAGAVVLILTDRNITHDQIPVHSLFATGAVHHRLTEAGLRCDANIVVETATARDPHHFSVLLGYGATAIYPYLAYECIQDLQRSGEITEKDTNTLFVNYRKGINKGLFKVTSKMGISTIASYRGSQLFESVGLHQDVVDLCFKNTTNRVSGIHFTDFEDDQRKLAKLAWNKRKSVDQGGLLKFIHGGEEHAYNPDVVHALQAAVKSGDYSKHKEYSRLVDNRDPLALRDMLALRDDIKAVDIDEVEPIEDIVVRFDSAAMSLGALSPEAHQHLAESMNALGGRSNSGEGGELPERCYNPKTKSKIKQVASGRFGVTPAYLRSAEVMQIKVAQGAKPGEGGQLPGHKVNDFIAKLRFCKPGVSLISPPPHHDIYSIEDLAQLIYDLKQINPDGLVSVKLVAEAGVGTIAAGVAKAYADLITISGYDGGTGASPLTSVKYAGSPWELGLTETHQILRANDLRDKVRLQTDGGLKTGLDVIKAAILGAESFGFGTGPMIAMGCKYLRICHLNNCATGVATQNNILRMEHYKGEVEWVMNYFKFIAQEVRELLAQLGCRKLTDIIGRTDLFNELEGNTSKQNKLNLSPILSDGGVNKDKARYCVQPKNEPFDKGELAEQMVKDTLPAIEAKKGGEYHYDVQNIHRSIGARVSGEIAVRHGDNGMEEMPITLRLKGTAGQSFGVWNAGGLHMYLEGDANDYVGKGMAGGKLVIHPPKGSAFKSHETTIIGNTCLYGATGGKLFASGTAGERFGVRNSGCTTVVEGIGDHGCEYMTGGVVAVLGETGINFGAGMTGGFAYVYDRQNNFGDNYNHDVEIVRIAPEHMEAHRNHLRELIEEFVEETGSERGQDLLDNFEDAIAKFWLVKPKAASLESLIDDMQRRAA